MSEENRQGILKKEMIFQKTRTLSLADVHSINMWGYNLHDVSILANCPNIQTISMPINSIRTLSPFQYCTNLKNLLLRQNLISSFAELKYLQNLSLLENLTLTDNPITSLPNYRSTVLSMLPQLKKLDNIDTFYTEGNNNENNDRSANIQVYKSVNFSKSYNINKDKINTESIDFGECSTINPIKNAYSAKNLNMKILIQNQKKKEQYKKQMQQIRQQNSQIDANSITTTDDSHFLTAVLTLIPELSIDSLQIVLDAIHQRCQT